MIASLQHLRPLTRTSFITTLIGLLLIAGALPASAQSPGGGGVQDRRVLLVTGRRPQQDRDVPHYADITLEHEVANTP